jgi:hypothetical protein
MGGFAGEILGSARRIGVSVFNDKVDVRLFVDVIEKRKRCGKDEHPNRR